MFLTDKLDRMIIFPFLLFIISWNHSSNLEEFQCTKGQRCKSVLDTWENNHSSVADIITRLSDNCGKLLSSTTKAELFSLNMVQKKKPWVNFFQTISGLRINRLCVFQKRMTVQTAVSIKSKSQSLWWYQVIPVQHILPSVSSHLFQGCSCIITTRQCMSTFCTQ